LGTIYALLLIKVLINMKIRSFSPGVIRALGVLGPYAPSPFGSALGRFAPPAAAAADTF
jgi:hypothetical protein